MSSRNQNGSGDDSAVFKSHLHEACDGVKSRFTKGDYKFLAKVGGGILLAYGCYKLYQHYYDNTFFISNYIPEYVSKSIPTTLPLTLILRKFADTANESDEKPSHKNKRKSNNRTFRQTSQYEDSEITLDDIQVPSHVQLKAQIERDSQVPLMPQEVTPPQMPRQPDRPVENISYEQDINHKGNMVVGVDNAVFTGENGEPVAQVAGDNNRDRNITYHGSVNTEGIMVVGVGNLHAPASMLLNQNNQQQ